MRSFGLSLSPARSALPGATSTITAVPANHAYLVFKVPPDRYDRTFNQTFCNSNTDFESLRDTARGIFSHLDRKHLSTD
jgi:hypothetical protein